VGDGAVGKTALLMTFTSGEFPSEYIPTICDNFRQTIEVDGKTVSLSLWDTAGQESYERLRPMSYRGADVFVMCFSTMSQSSYDNIAEKWVPEIRHHRPDTPILLVGTKTDMRDAPDEEAKRVVEQQKLSPIASAKGEELARRQKCVKYIECSAKTEHNIRAVFEEAVRVHWHNLQAIHAGESKKKKSCLLV
jgi:Ras-related C3 botulinum toxin substrate 1